MRIRTAYKTTPNSNVGTIVATGMGKQKSTRIDQSRSLDANHGIAAANLVIHVNSGLHPLERQNADDLRVSAVRSIDSGASTHESNDDGTVHIFNV